MIQTILSLPRACITKIIKGEGVGAWLYTQAAWGMLIGPKITIPHVLDLRTYDWLK